MLFSQGPRGVECSHLPNPKKRSFQKKKLHAAWGRVFLGLQRLPGNMNPPGVGRAERTSCG